MTTPSYKQWAKQQVKLTDVLLTHTPEQIVQAVNSHDALVAALKHAHISLRTFRNVPQAEQAWTTIDDDVMAAIENALDLTE